MSKAGKFDNLSDTNYPAWSKWMRAHLVLKDVWQVASGGETRPVGSPNNKVVRAWVRKRDIASAEILLHVSEKYTTHCDEEDPVATLERLRLLFRAQGQSTISSLRRQFHSMLKDPDDDMREWITKVKTLARQLRELESPLNDVDIINTLTRGLGDEFTPLIVLFDSLPADPNHPECITVDYVIQRLINEEVRITSTHTEAAFWVRSPAVQSKTHNSRKCFFCGEDGHIRSECDVTPRQLYGRRQGRGQITEELSNVQAKAAITYESDIAEVSVL